MSGLIDTHPLTNEQRKYLSIQFYLFTKEFELSEFQKKVIDAKRINKQTLAKHRLLRPGDFEMTPEEELFVSFFNPEKIAVKDLDDLQLQARREELAAIALEARAKVAAIDAEKRERKAKKGKTFESLIESDENSGAINNIRKSKQTKAEKMLENLTKLMGNETVAKSMMSAGKILTYREEKELKKEIGDVKEIETTKISEDEEEKPKVNNPFANYKKS